MSERKYSFDTKAHTRASTAEEVSERNTYSRVERDRDSLRGPLSVGAIATIAILAVALNQSSSSEMSEPQPPSQHIEVVTPEE
ncbi:MAG TPA: hypothetical protein VGE13_03385 [Candidatus Saccharimonadales bacterium]